LQLRRDRLDRAQPAVDEEGELGRNVGSIILVMVLFQWPLSCRLVRNMTVSIKEWEFVQAARGFGAGGFHTTLRHIPGVVGPLTVAGTLLAATARSADHPHGPVDQLRRRRTA
jgi:ABC-type spermidine/putrescine transport system permease subunit II